MAAAIFNRVAQERGLPMSASSAGTHPADRVHPNVALAMEEWGIDLTRVSPRLLTDEAVSAARRVITMGCEVDADACPGAVPEGRGGLGSGRSGGAGCGEDAGDSGLH